MNDDALTVKSALATVAGHFGELIQGRLGPSGPVALITLPCPALSVTASFTPGGFELWQSEPAVLSDAQAREFMDAAGLPREGIFRIHAEMPPGAGAGASTAARVAMARAAGCTLSPEALARACVASEGASDPLMFAEPERLLWASRRGAILATLPALAEAEIMGGFFGQPQRTDPADEAFPDIADLAEAWPAATASLARLAAIASESARRSLGLRGLLNADPTAALAARCGALGWAAAHTGSARALIFAPGAVPNGARKALEEAGFAQITQFCIRRGK